MGDLPRQPFKLQPTANPASIVQGDKWRFTFLTDGILRYEWADDGIFEDRASTFAINRDLPVPKIRIASHEPLLEIVTDRMLVVYNRKPFSASGFTVQLKSGGSMSGDGLWRYGYNYVHGTGMRMENLGGTARTLDEADGRIDVGEGILSKKGCASIDDSESMLFTNDGWFTTRREGNRTDGYVFMYGLDYKEAIKAFYKVSGAQSLLPRWAFGNWWSRYYPYNAEEYLKLMDKFKSEGVPLSVAVIDMDWHRVEDVPAKYGSGWTGYSWNKKLFPEPAAFLKGLTDRDLKTTLNVHPADGIREFEDAYHDVAKALGHDTTHGDAIAFDCTDPKFMKAYFEVLHRQLEDQGVDFWWLDWQQGPHSRVDGVDPLWVLNHYHFLDSGREGRRPITFSRYAGPGSHRYPVGFSGDTIVTWASLDFQPEFTNCASNVGYGNWSHDIGGHMFGGKDDELATRWLQLGVFSPILRLHSSMNLFNSKEPWRFSKEVCPVMIDNLRLRHRLMPYLYTMNVLASRDGEPIVQPMYWSFPKERVAYRVPNQFNFGSQLVVMPITSPRDIITKLGKVRGWFPPGKYVDIFSGTVYAGDREMWLYRPLDEYPVFAKAGSIIPMDAEGIPPNGGNNPEALEILVVVGADASFDLLEDDGRGSTVDDVELHATHISYTHSDYTLRLKTTAGKPRSWSFRFLGLEDAKIHSTSGNRNVDVLRQPNGAVVHLGQLPPSTDVVLTFDRQPEFPPMDPHSRIWPILDGAQLLFEIKERMWMAVISQDPLHVRVSRMQAMAEHSQDLVDAVLEYMLADPKV